jgi:hypothetical protein
LLPRRINQKRCPLASTWLVGLNKVLPSYPFSVKARAFSTCSAATLEWAKDVVDRWPRSQGGPTQQLLQCLFGGLQDDISKENKMSEGHHRPIENRSWIFISSMAKKHHHNTSNEVINTRVLMLTTPAQNTKQNFRLMLKAPPPYLSTRVGENMRSSYTTTRRRRPP